jgi:hypothetical protein
LVEASSTGTRLRGWAYETRTQKCRRNYPFEKSHRFVEIQPNASYRDYSRLSCGAGETQLEPMPGSTYSPPAGNGWLPSRSAQALFDCARRTRSSISSTARFASASFCASRARSTTFVLAPMKTNPRPSLNHREVIARSSGGDRIARTPGRGSSQRPHDADLAGRCYELRLVRAAPAMGSKLGSVLGPTGAINPTPVAGFLAS